MTDQTDHLLIKKYSSQLCIKEPISHVSLPSPFSGGLEFQTETRSIAARASPARGLLLAGVPRPAAHLMRRISEGRIQFKMSHLHLLPTNYLVDELISWAKV